MRMFVLVLLILAPAGAIAYHFGPGQANLALDDADRILQRAAGHVTREEYSDAIAAYTAAIDKIPSSQTELIRRVRLERAKAAMQIGGLPEAFDELTALKDEVEISKADTSSSFVRDLRKTMADAQYYMTWLQRLEGEPRQAWEPDIEASRQNYKLLAEMAHADGDKAAAQSREQDLESAIRLARLDLSELQALPMPKQCQGCCSGNCNCKGNKKGRSQKQGSQKTEDARGASSGLPPDEKGS